MTVSGVKKYNLKCVKTPAWLVLAVSHPFHGIASPPAWPTTYNLTLTTPFNTVALAHSQNNKRFGSQRVQGCLQSVFYIL